ncbi:MAG TPA: ATP adenylyltransferase [Archangium sp.]|uniref:ATP adenylyltransferase family protein n=1 Tax=Archangium sp. TaxID=1872627 RepID=UPI002E31E563|nr:ATP adenylyltransferase [Archangium sp.]HEX5754242.1 ATP adenylyltransferase [Archangium sp.]
MSTPSLPHEPSLRPEDLWPRIVSTTRHALATGALQPIATECQTLEERGIPFQVRVLGRAHLKDERARREKPRAVPFDPFENPDPDLIVGGLSPTHLCLLNKFNVVEHHLLIVTRAFEEQESLLTAADFEALALCMDGLDGLGFYNSGEVAGASQPHKHLQLIPPLGPEGLRVPMEKVLPGAPGFAHAVTRLGPWESSPARDGARMLAAYQSLMKELGIGHPLPPYNLLTTRDWMLLVPRARAESHGINVNAMGFAGSLLVKNQEQLQKLQELGPLELLRQVAPESRPG